MPYRSIIVVLVGLIAAGCVGVPAQVTTVENFDAKRYMGTWYEIARLDHSFERGLENVTAQYSLRNDGGIDVLNQGFDPRTRQWKQARGRAYFVSGSQTGRLKVSFFGPFYGSYNIMALDEKAYSYALVCGPTTAYLWILARGPRLDPAVQSALIQKARDFGFPTDHLIMVKH